MYGLGSERFGDGSPTFWRLGPEKRDCLLWAPFPKGVECAEIEARDQDPVGRINTGECGRASRGERRRVGAMGFHLEIAGEAEPCELGEGVLEPGHRLPPKRAVEPGTRIGVGQIRPNQAVERGRSGNGSSKRRVMVQNRHAIAEARDIEFDRVGTVFRCGAKGRDGVLGRAPACAPVSDNSAKSFGISKHASSLDSTRAPACTSDPLMRFPIEVRSREETGPVAPKIRATLIQLGVLILAMSAGVVAIPQIAFEAASRIEAQLERGAKGALDAAGFHWATVEVDGLRLRLEGHAPNPETQAAADRLLARVSPLAEIVSLTSADLAAPVQASEIRIGIERSLGAITLVGQVNGAAMRRDVARSLSAVAPQLAFRSLLRTDARQPPRDWGSEIALAVVAVAGSRRAQLTVTPGRIEGTAVVAGAEARFQLLQRLQSLAADRVEIDIAIETTRQVIAPFAVTVSKIRGALLRVSRCAARSPEEAARIAALLAAREVLSARDCAVGLGGPGGDWTGAVAALLELLDEIEEGRADLVYDTLHVTLPNGVGPDAEAVMAERLPPGYRLEIASERPPDPPAGPTEVWLRAKLESGRLTLSGRLAPLTSEALSAIALAEFGDTTESDITSAEATPPGWDVETAAALRAIAGLDHAELSLAPGALRIAARLTSPEAALALRDRLRAALPEARIRSAITIDLPAAVASVPPTPARCTHLLNRLSARDALRFEPGRAVLDRSTARALDRLAEILASCPESRFEIGGHTDSQGSAEMNARLSASRAEAVRNALLERGIPLRRLETRGYGETRPVASNDSPAGRAQNRRIEFSQIDEALP